MTVTADGKTTAHKVSGAPDIHPVVSGNTSRHAMVTVRLSPGLSAYSFTFG